MLHLRRWKKRDAEKAGREPYFFELAEFPFVTINYYTTP
jgi:hypothetical protein